MKEFFDGFKKGLPVAVAYFVASFAFGVLSVKGFTPLGAFLISLTNFSSAGELAGLEMILKNTGYIELGITMLLINLRYIIMSLSLSQRLDPSMPTWKRMILSFGIVDEVYAIVIMEKKKQISFKYYLGMFVSPLIGWTIGTVSGALGATIFSERFLTAMDISLYAMLVSCIVPECRKEKPILFVVLVSLSVSCFLEFVPYVNTIGYGFKIIISTLIAAILGALIFPIKEEEEAKENV